MDYRGRNDPDILNPAAILIFKAAYKDMSYAPSPTQFPVFPNFPNVPNSNKFNQPTLPQPMTPPNGIPYLAQGPLPQPW